MENDFTYMHKEGCLYKLNNHDINCQREIALDEDKTIIDWYFPFSFLQIDNLP